MKVCEMAQTERPDYRAENGGVASLCKPELLQLICRNHDLDANYALMGMAGSLRQLYRYSLAEIEAIPGIGRKGAIAIKAALELGRRSELERTEYPLCVRSPADAANALMPTYRDATQEHFIVMGMDNRNRVMYTQELYKGTVSSLHVRVAEVLAEAVKVGAVCILVAHNHPSGDPSPSPEDVAITKQIREGAETLDIELLDHLILGQGRWMSLKERGLGFS